MTCDEFEIRFLAGQENPLTTAERAAGKNHLAECAACRALTRQLQQLDATLTAKVKAPVLSTDFNQRLAIRIQAATTVLSEARRAERKRQLQAEYEAGRAQLRRTTLRLTSLVEGLPYVVLAALAGWLVWLIGPGLSNSLAAQGLSGSGQTMLLATVAGTVFLAIGLTAAFPRTFRQICLPG